MPPKLRILFVDDEPLVLQGLQRMLRGMRDEWEMHFVDGGHAGLEALKQHDFAVVVSDMRMPRMSGAEFLNEVMQRHPGTIRIVLSGHADQDLILQCAAAAHQYLSKPCDPEQLKKVIQETLHLRGSVQNIKLRELLLKETRLPSPPTTYTQLNMVLASETATMGEIAEIIIRDVALGTHVLKLANSAFFSLGRPVSTISEALNHLGTEMIKAISLAHGVFNRPEKINLPHFNLNQLWQHSLHVGFLARKIAALEGVSKECLEQSITAGLLHDVGILVMASNVQEIYGPVLQAVHQGSTLVDEERRTFGMDHGEFGATILQLWGIPEPVVEATAHHHDLQRAECTTFTPLIAVHIADTLTRNTSGLGFFEGGCLEEGCLKRIAMRSSLDDWKRQLSNLVETRGAS